jgi:hypothetical protein
MSISLFVLSIALASGSLALNSESPFACHRAALSAKARKRHFDVLGPALRARHTNVRELADGYEFDFPSNPETIRLLTEWVASEQLCCPFFDIDVRIEREGGPLSLRLTGREGVKQFVRAEFSRWFAKAG